MKITHWFRRKVSAATRALTVMMPLPHGFGMKANYESIAREGYMTNSVVFACIREIAGASAGVPWQLFQTQSDGTQKELTDHPLLKLIDRPNPFQGRFELIENLTAYLYLSGNAYVEAVSPSAGNRSAKPPTELYVLRPDRMSILPDPTHFIRSYVLGTNNNDYLELLVQETSGFSTFTLDIAQVQLEKGSIASPFQFRPLAMELDLAQRYYAKTYDFETDPGTATSTGYVDGGASGLVSGGHAIRVHWSFPVRLRKAPIINLYSLNGTIGKWTDVSNTDRSATALRTGHMGTNIEVSIPTGSDVRVGGHITADAEL
jgi:hypothetical protein